MCLQAQGIDNDDSGLDGGRRFQGLSNNDVCVIRGREIDNASNQLETSMEAAGGTTKDQRDLQKRRRRRKRKLSRETSTTTTEALVEDRQYVQGIGDKDVGGSGSKMGLKG